MEGLAKVAIAYLPFLALFGLLYFVLRSGRSHSKAMMDEQAQIQRDIARHLDRIATALEQRKP
jgi:hypothetical protein